MEEIKLIEPDYERSSEILRKYREDNRERFDGKRCFIIGNGPSLKPEDLDKIKNEFSIACNRIYLIFDRTEWRPNIWTATDRNIIKISIPEIANLKAELKILGVNPAMNTYPIEGTIHIKSIANTDDWLRNGGFPPFSDDALDCVHHGMSVTYMNIQLAVWLGFREIILMGMDHQYRRHWHILSKSMTEALAEQLKNLEGVHGRLVEVKGVQQDHFCADYGKGYVSAQGDEISNYCIDEVTRAYMSARRYAEKHGIRIINATRGGKLEVFERINFDRLMSCAETPPPDKSARLTLKGSRKQLKLKKSRNK